MLGAGGRGTRHSKGKQGEDNHRVFKQNAGKRQADGMNISA